jgi:hypothetical protein
MGQWSEPYKETRDYKTKDGRDYQVIHIYIYMSIISLLDHFNPRRQELLRYRDPFLILS